MRHRWLWGLILVLTITLTITGGAVAGGRSGPLLYGSEYRCLIFDGGLENGTLLDLRNNLSRFDPRPRAGAIPTRFGQDSPDGKYRANLVWNNKFDSTNSLYIYPTAGGERVIQADIQAPFHFYWSPDSQRMAYFWVRAQRGFLTVATPDGSDIRTVELVDRDVYEVFLHGWSPDGRYLLIGNRVETGRRFELWSAETLTAHNLPLHNWVGEPSWLPDGRHLLYQYDPRVLASPLTTPTLALSIVALDTRTETPYPLDGQPESLRLGWSGDGQWLYAQYFSAFPRMQVDVLGVDGREFRAVTLTEIPGLFSDQGVARWVQGTTQLVHIYQQGAGTPVSLRIFNPTTGERLTLVDDMPRRYAPSPADPNRIAVVERVEDRVRGVVMNADGTDRQTVFEGEGDFGDPDWSPDGQYVAFTWARWDGPNRLVNLSWVSTDGSSKQTIENYEDIKEVRWLPHNIIAFVGKQVGAGYFAPYVVDMNTVTVRNFNSQLWLLDVWRVDVEPTAQLYRVWWQRWDGGYGMTALDSAGQIRQQFRFSDPILDVNALKVVLAPGGAAAAIKLGVPRRSEMLQLAKADGSWSPVIVSDLKGLGDPVWSPDGKLIAFTQAQNSMAQFSPIMLAVYTADGQHVRTITGKSSFYSNLTWTRCD